MSFCSCTLFTFSYLGDSVFFFSIPYICDFSHPPPKHDTHTQGVSCSQSSV
jgi:hypothetical protein